MGSWKARMMWGNATFTEESNGTTRVPRPTTAMPHPVLGRSARRWGTGPVRVIRARLQEPATVRSDSLFQCRGGLEAHGLAGLDLDRLAGAWIEALARLGLANGEGAEAGKGEFAGLFQLPHDGFHQIAGRAVRGGAGEFGGLLNDCCYEGFRHAGSLL